MSLGFAPGAAFAAYRIESIVGRGGMGVVYRAIEPSLQRTVALKLIAPEFSQDPGFRSRFLRESRLAASLEHPSVVPIYEAGEHDGQLYLAMRYVDGSDLRTLLKREGTLAPGRSLGLLAQIADALDAAHRRGLVHRDVKPANVLIDDDGHAYLTDFGVSKQLGGDSTESGHLVGTLDYIAPEQIRGDPIDARADVYALGCVIYQSLAGAAPFHRATEAETLWAHMQEDPPALAQHPTLTPVLRKALAKHRDERYPDCAELIEAARAALARPAVPRALLRRRHAILAAGLLVLATAAALIVTLPENDRPRPPPIGNGIASIGATGKHVGTFTGAAMAPSNVAVGEGAVWALSTELDTISRIDARTGKVVKTFRAGARPSDIAAGGGAIWVGDGSGQFLGITARILRVDPDSGAITRNLRLPNAGEGDPQPPGPPSGGFPQIAVGAGAVWARNPDGTVSRIDPRTGDIDATVKTEVAPSTIAAGREGVWFLSWNQRAIFSIDTRTNRVGQRIPVASDFLSGIAVGAGSVWATSPQDGLLWRIEPGPRPLARSIPVGTSVDYVAYGDGAVWTADYVNGTATRVDPRTNRVVARVQVGASQSLAVGAGAAWVSVAAGTKDGKLPPSICSEVVSGGTTPDVLIASDLPLQGPDATDSRAMADAIRFVLKDHDYRTGRYTVGYQSCDDSTAQVGHYEQRRCAANANAYARADRLVAVIGPAHSFCAQAQIATLNQAPGGPLAMLTPSASFTNLTRGRFAPPEEGLRGEPDVYYPTGVRNFFRLTARDDHAEWARVVLAKQLGLEDVYLLRNRADRVTDTFEAAYRWAASRLGVRIAGASEFSSAERYDAVADRVARTGAEGVMVYDNVYAGGDRLLKALRDRLRRATIMVGEGFGEIPEVIRLAGPAARGLYVTVPVLPPAGLEPTPALRRFVRDFGDVAHDAYAVHAAQAAEAVLAAIARSDGTRASVLEQLHELRIEDGILGGFSFDRYGDMKPPMVAVLRVARDTPAGVRLPSRYQGAVVDRVVTVPASLTE